MAEFKVKSIELAERGKLKIYWASRHMPVLNKIKKDFLRNKPLKGVRIGACLHVTKETAVLVETLISGGAEVTLVPSNPMSTQDDVAAALAKEGVRVFAWKGMSEREYYFAIAKAIEFKPNITMDDGADLVSSLHKIYYNEKSYEIDIIKKNVKNISKDNIESIVGGTEETTTGVNRLRAMDRDRVLLYPIIAVNDSLTKFMFDNRYGTGQSSLDGIIRATNILFAGKRVVVAGYGWCGRGIALRAKGLGSHVIVTEVDPIKALEAFYDGFEVMSMEEAAKIGDIFITSTGDKNVIRKEHIENMKDGAILANAGHFNVEISIPDLESLSISKRTIRDYVVEYKLKNEKNIYLLADGRLVNLVAAEGHPSEVMDMSFSNQALAVKYLLENKDKLNSRVYRLPREIDERIASFKLKSLGVNIDKLTEEQRRYLSEWKEGT